MISFLLFIHIGYWIIRIDWRSKFSFFPIFGQSSLQSPQVFSLFNRIFIVFKEFDISSLSVDIRRGAENSFFVHLFDLLFELFDFLVQGILHVEIACSESSRKITPLSAPVFFRIHFVVNTENPISIFRDNIFLFL